MPHQGGRNVNRNSGHMLRHRKYGTTPFRGADGGYLFFADGALPHEEFADLTPTFLLLVCRFLQLLNREQTVADQIKAQRHARNKPPAPFPDFTSREICCSAARGKQRELQYQESRILMPALRAERCRRANDLWQLHIWM